MLKSFLLKRGKIIKPYDPIEEEIEKVRFNWLKGLNIKTVIDIGASDGGYASRARVLFPKAMIYSVEALEDSYRKLLNRFKGDNQFKAFNIGVSNEIGEASFYQCDDYTGSSSLLKMGGLHKEIYPQTKNNTKINIEVTTLDYLLKNELLDENILLKIDVQGAELLVLKGADSLLGKVKVIFTEVNFNELYEDSVMFETLQGFLKKYNFTIQGIENVSQSNIDGKFLQADVFFVRK